MQISFQVSKITLEHVLTALPNIYIYIYIYIIDMYMLSMINKKFDHISVLRLYYSSVGRLGLQTI